MPAALAPPVAVTWPPEITMPSATGTDETPPPMPAAFAPPCATIVPLSMTILPGAVKPPAEPMPAAFWPPVAESEPSPLTVSVAVEATSMPAEYWPSPVRAFSPESVSVTSRDNLSAGASFFTGPTSVSFLSVMADAPEVDGTTMRYSPFVEKPCTTASAEIVTTPVSFANDHPRPELSTLLATTPSFTTRCPRTETLPLSSMSNEK